jgi:polyphosphate kinase
VQLIVRGICCLRPGVEGVSENIEVVSIVGRFLEHSRVYYFRNGGEDQMYIGSADLMPRNIEHRVEVLFPIEDDKLIREVRDDILSVYLTDNVKARRMLPSGSYVRKRAAEGKRRVNAQEKLLDRRTRARRPKPPTPPARTTEPRP